MHQHTKKIIALMMALILSFSTTITVTATELTNSPTTPTTEEDSTEPSSTVETSVEPERGSEESVDSENNSTEIETAENTESEVDSSTETKPSEATTDSTESDKTDPEETEDTIETEESEEPETEEIEETSSATDIVDSEDYVGPGIWSDKDPYFTEDTPAIPENTSIMRRAPRIINYPTQEEAYQAIIALQDELPEGMTWTNHTPYGNQGPLGECYWFRGGAVKGARGGVGCAGFAFRVSDAAFGDTPARVVNSGNFTFDDLKVGDILRVNNSHFVIIQRVTSSGVILAEGNFNKTVHWGRAMSKEEVMASTNFVVTRYPAGYSEDATLNTTIAQGTEGNLSWTLLSNGVLTITGNGPMASYTETNRPSWEAYKNQIYTVEIQNGVTNVGAYTFYQYDQIITASLPASITQIGANAFQGSNLINITIPSSVGVIGDNAFNSCASLTSVTVPEGVQKIGISAFQGCNALNYVDFPSTIIEIGSGAFSECQYLYRVRFAPGNNTVIMGDNMFMRCWRLNEVTLPLQADKISSGMFSACGMLQYLYIPSGIKDIEGVGGISGSPFSGTALALIDFGGSESEWNAKNGPSALTYAGLTNKTVVHFSSDFDDPFAIDPDDPGDIVFPCADGHVGEADESGNCTVCGDPFEPQENNPEPSTPDDSGNTGDDNNNSSNTDESNTPNAPDHTDESDNNSANSSNSNSIEDIPDTENTETPSSETTDEAITSDTPIEPAKDLPGQSNQIPPTTQTPPSNQNTADTTPTWSDWTEVIPSQSSDRHWSTDIFPNLPSDAPEDSESITESDTENTESIESTEITTDYDSIHPEPEKVTITSVNTKTQIVIVALGLLVLFLGTLALLYIKSNKNDDEDKDQNANKD